MLTALARYCAIHIHTYVLSKWGRVGVLVGCQSAACEVWRLLLIRLLTGRQWSRNQDEISCLTDSSLSHLTDGGGGSTKRKTCSQISLINVLQVFSYKTPDGHN